MLQVHDQPICYRPEEGGSFHQRDRNELWRSGTPSGSQNQSSTNHHYEIIGYCSWDNCRTENG